MNVLFTIFIMAASLLRHYVFESVHPILVNVKSRERLEDIFSKLAQTSIWT